MSTRNLHGRVGRIFWLIAAAALIMAVMPLAGAATPSDEPLSADQVTQDVPEMSIDGRDRTETPTRDLDSTGRVTVEIVHRSGADRAAIQGEVGRLHGSVLGSSPGVTLVKVPPVAVAAFERRPDVAYVRSPLRVDLLPGPPDASGFPMDIGDVHVTATNADAWQNAGHQGDGVKVGIVDYFDGGAWTAAQSSGDVPAPAGTFCQFEGSTCNIWSAGSRHGVAVAEIVHDMAPGATLYLATAGTVTDLSAAVAWFESEGVQIISRSLGADLDGPGDGTGSVDAVVDDAVSRGMVWLNAAGNHASASGIDGGGYWRGSYVDADGNGFMEFAPGDEQLGFLCGGIQGFRWSDWQATGRTDYDIYITDPDGNVIAGSFDDQTAGAPPIEIPGYIDCGTYPVVFLWVELFDAGSGTSGDILEFMVNQTYFEYSSNPYSASGPASDSANTGAVAIGAIDPAAGAVIAPYSSQGPTNDGRIKPDLSAPSCLPNVSYAPDCFNGTSAATPVAAGAAALVWGADVATTPQTVAQYLTTHVIDRGTTGSDNVYGAGQLYLGDPPVVPPTSGLLRVATSPAVPSQVLVDGVLMNTWGLTWVKVPAGSHEVSFTDVQGFTTPDAEVVTVAEGATTTVTGAFGVRGWLQVTTSPAVPATIFVDGVAMNDWGVWTDLEAGSYEVCFGDVADYTAPGCETVAVTGGATTSVEGAFVSSPGSAGPTGHGYLRVTTDPAVPAQILVDGVARDTWGLNWLKLAPGVYEVAFTDIQGFSTPGVETVTVTAGATTVVAGAYVARGGLQVATSPAVPATIYVDGIPRNDWGMWTDLPVAGYDVCFGDVAGYTAPACEIATVTVGSTTSITGTYVSDP